MNGFLHQVFGGALFYFKGLGDKLRAVAAIPVPFVWVILVSLAVGTLALMFWLTKKKYLRAKKELEERLAQAEKENDTERPPPRRRPRSRLGSGVGLSNSDDFD